MPDSDPAPGDGWVAVEDVYPQVDCGRFPVKRVVGETLEVWADAFKPGDDSIGVAVQLKGPGQDAWSELPMELFANDRWVAKLRLADLGLVRYRVTAWTDRFGTMLRGLEKWAAAGEDVGPEKRALAALVEEAASGTTGDERGELRGFAREIREAPGGGEAAAAARSPRLSLLMWRFSPRKDATSSPDLSVVVDRPEAEFASWYEMFPRSQGKLPGEGSTFRECEARIHDISSMGFDVLYLPPIHPIGRTNRRGRNNTPDPGPRDPGSPWAIGSKDGGHDAVDPGLGTIEDFRHLVAEAGRAGMEVALDLAFQCSPDHPYVESHPEWFYHREDGSIRYAENPPKKYHDIYPLAFDGPAWQGLWEEMKRVTLFWVSKGVRTFRMDNPHTKPTRFWEWLIAEVKRDHPDVIFLAEAFTAPKPMKRLSKAGFTQSYTYFTWKNTKPELEEFLREFVLSETAEYYRGNFFANTPDILHAYLQKGGRAAFKVRLALAATLSPLYGIYSGFELCENTPREEGSEEYLDSEKYQYKARDWDSTGNIKGYITKVNRIRKDNPALRLRRNLRLLPAEDASVFFYAKWTPDRSNIVAVAANLDPHSARVSRVAVPAGELGLGPKYAAKELIGGASYTWEGEGATVSLDPQVEPVQIFSLGPEARSR